jgi:hypothetical protein
MKFTIYPEMPKRIFDKLSFILYISFYLEYFFKNKNYGDGVKVFYLGVLCNEFPPDTLLSDTLEKKYYKKRKELVYDILLDYHAVTELNLIDIQAMLTNEIQIALKRIGNEFKIIDFDLENFHKDLQEALELIAPDVTAIFGNWGEFTEGEMLQKFDAFLQIQEHNDRMLLKEESKKEVEKEKLEVSKLPHSSMNVAAFWRLIEKTKQESAGEQEKHEELLIEALSRLPYPDIGTFHAIYHFYHQLADRPKLITAAAIICDGLTNDDFEYFRPWLIGEGEKVYKKALANPDSLVDVVKTDEFAEFELLMAVAIEATERKHEGDKVEYWLTYGQPEEYELNEAQMDECKRGIVFDLEIDNEVFGWATDDRDEERFQAMRLKAFPRLIAKCEGA